ncbi:FtsQ-type POTRA domain-containing protein [Glaciihabitans arcticus]|uniref:FtsQ-type POTRA domain-containing protein n=1 Tax=Glaciihabitans arcticus TaxID=2668039 RepID=A0A4Q9H068_9MICO|nr:FtsQ-type POTRA domain-containing protein [Glaciihabitans arcticus]
MRRAARERKRFERGEVRRFTRRLRSRRAFWLTTGGIAATLVLVLAIAVFSPILALREITIQGTSRIDKKDVLAAVNGQLGTPLALVDEAQLERALSAFPLIRSYVTETVPPNTLIINIEEREPVGVIQRGEEFDLVDPAGVPVQTTAERPADVPLIVVDGAETEGAAFDSAVEVLLALPPAMLAQVDTITASTQDDVRFVIRGVGQSVIWGSADRSAYKARVLTALFAKTKQSVKYEYDVSAPESAVITRR